MVELDYVIVGAGAAGCTLAARLAVAPGASVGLIEAGGPYRRVLDIPLLGLWAWLRRPQAFSWQDLTVPQSALGGRRIQWPSGRLVGGSSAINAMMYSRGARASYQRWRDDHSREWSYETLLPYFLRAEDQERGASVFHGTGGPLSVSDSRHKSELGRAFIAGCMEAGIPETDDVNGVEPAGAGFLQVTQANGRRASAVNYLRGTSGGKRVTLRSGTVVSRVVIERGRAVGVECVSDGRTELIRARREVILCAGTVRSPQLLMLSGIGPAGVLRALGIRVVADSPEVGLNLQDHVRIPVISRFSGRRLTSARALVGAALDYAIRRRGLLTSNVCDAVAIVALPESRIPAVRIVCQWRALPEERERYIDFEVVLIDPRSRGRVTLSTNDPFAPPIIDPGYLTDPEDLERLARGVDIARAIAASASCRRVGVGGEFQPGALDVGTHARRTAQSAYHPVGTCRLAGESSKVGGVVDAKLRVNGVSGLRVVDASVMPTTVSGNAQAAVIAIAERAADLIRGSHTG